MGQNWLPKTGLQPRVESLVQKFLESEEWIGGDKL